MEDILQMLVVDEANDQDIENMILYFILNRKEGRPPVVKFNLNDFPEEEARGNFRFEKQDIFQLKQFLGIPDVIKTETRNTIGGVSALAILLRRLCYPNRWQDLSSFFNLSPQSLSQICLYTMNLIWENKGALLEDLGNLQFLNNNKLQQYAKAVYEKGGAVQKCWGFIDGTTRQICRPSINQEEYYSGHKRYHCVKYQSVLVPDGLIVSLKGAWPGRRHDAGIMRESNLYQELEELARLNGNYLLYGDSAYGVRELLLSPFTGANLEEFQYNFNDSMKRMRITVEWGFQKVIQQFAFLDFEKNQKLLWQDVETMYKVGVLLTNCHTCLYSSETAQYFGIQPHTLDQYLG